MTTHNFVNANGVHAFFIAFAAHSFRQAITLAHHDRAVRGKETASGKNS
jgi:hypothetical protein